MGRRRDRRIYLRRQKRRLEKEAVKEIREIYFQAYFGYKPDKAGKVLSKKKRSGKLAAHSPRARRLFPLWGWA